MSDLQKLRKLAEKANPGPWIEKRDPFDVERIHIVDPDDEIICSVRGTTRNSYFIATANPQAIIELLDRLERYEKALRSCEVRSGHIENWHRDHVTPDNFKDCQDVGVTPEAYLRETKMIAREALEGGK